MIKIKEFIDKHIDYKINVPSFFSILIAISILPCYLYLPKEFGYENGLLENLQMIVLFLCMCFCFTARNSKIFFKILSLFIIILALREINCGRIFFPIPGKVNAFYHWKDIKYGFLVNPIYGLFITLSFVLFLIFKGYNELFAMITKTKLPFWNIMFFLFGAFGSWYVDKHMHSYVLEEMVELLMYIAICGLIYIYAFNKDKNIDNNLVEEK